MAEMTSSLTRDGSLRNVSSAVQTGSFTLTVSTNLDEDALDEAFAKSVQSAALSLLQPDDEGKVAKEDVARVWLTNVLPALERVGAGGRDR